MSSIDSMSRSLKATSSCPSKTQITFKERLKNAKFLEKLVTTPSYSIPATFMLVPSGIR